ncbi:thiol:disulfide interchange protein DsbD [Angulomicrobium tetraedrale]|uniref:Thiol:disulfide interchange protein DsbD n=1 Tax=Ancylobacter tetraedralis TaxID=217068 RepID=A0A839ZFB8_9HYPH|nr:thiol:disulfide interchange protein DsbD [Ancylobacter tetraedralis]
MLACLSPLSAGANEAAGFTALFAPSTARAPFTLEAARSPSGALLLRWKVGPGNYLYRDSLEATLDGVPVPLERPAGEAKNDPNFGVVQIFHRDVEASAGDLAHTDRLRVSYQGCSDRGICFPPQVRLVDLATLAIEETSPGLETPPADASSRESPASAAAATGAPVAVGVEANDSDGTEALLQGGLGWTMLAFLGFGLLLALTPCVFPMIPILAGMLTRSGEALTWQRSLVLTGAYVLAMAGAYGLVGAVAGWSGANLQAALQTPLALGLTAVIFLALALSMFGLFDLALPAGLSARLAGRGGNGSIGGAAVLGFGSALIVGPCVTPPLAGAMLYAAATGDAATGAGALFMLGLGMGLPLMLVGLFGPALLPRGGVWLERAKQAFGVVFLGVAILLAGRLLPPPATLAMLGVLLVGSAAFFGGFDRLTASSGPAARFARGGGMVAALYGATLIIGAAGGAQDALRPLAFAAAPAAQPVKAAVTVVSSATFDQAISGAADGASGRPILVDFTAAWCTVCKSNATIMAAPELRTRLAALKQVTADVTDYNAATRALMERFRVVGPPALFLVDAQGREIPGSRIVGPVTVEEITRRLDAAGA